MNIGDLNAAMQQNLSNAFDGKPVENGSNLISFSGATGFHDSESSDRRFEFTLDNERKTSLVVALLAGLYRTAYVTTADAEKLGVKYQGVLIDGKPAFLTYTDDNNTTTKVQRPILMYDSPEALKEAGIDANVVLDDGIRNILPAAGYDTDTGGGGPLNARKLTASTVLENRKWLKVHYEQGKTPRLWTEFIRAGHGVHIPRLFVSSSNPEAYKQKLILIDKNPFEDKGKKYINIFDYYRPNQQNNNVVIVDKDFILKPETIMLYTIPAETSVKFSFIVGGIAGAENALEAEFEAWKRGVNAITNKIY